MSDEDVTITLATCPQQVVRVGLVEFVVRRDTRAVLYTAADRRPTNQVSAWQAEREVARQARHARHPRSTLARMSRVSGASARMLRGCYDETAPEEFRLYRRKQTVVLVGRVKKNLRGDDLGC